MKLKPIKPSNFYITKAQMTYLMDIGLGEIQPVPFTNREKLELQFICLLSNQSINRGIMLALINKQLLRIDYRSITVCPTKLGIRMLKIKNRNPSKSGIVYVPKHLVKSADLKVASKYKVA